MVQADATAEVAANLAAARAEIATAAAAGAALVVLPENVLCRGSYDQMRAAARDLGHWDGELGPISAAHGVTVIWGGVAVAADDGCLYNTALVYDPSGSRRARYRKMHLFQLSARKAEADESQLFTPGSEPMAFGLDGWRIGLTICYDLRFPELYRAYAGAELMVCTAEFTRYTGRAHWEPMLRSRAIENQCYVLGVNQCRRNRTTAMQAYGHSLAVDPWGAVVARAGEGAECVHCSLDRSVIKQTRTRIPALAARRGQI
jgi:nitrilase